ncbi:hypothetical protein ACO0RG_004457 [Hanseniaspora osmophila]
MAGSMDVHGNEKHQIDDEDDEQFLYGDDNNNNNNNNNDTSDNKTTKKRKLSGEVVQNDDLNDLYSAENNNKASTSRSPPKKQMKLSNEKGQEEEEGEEGEGEESGSESEYETDESDDVQFIIGTGSNPQQLSSKSAKDAKSVAAGTTTTTTTTAAAASEDTSKETQQSTLQQSRISANPLIDLDAKGLYEGEPIEEVDPEIIKEKPWRGANAKMSDYFNYGFNEATWMEYLHRQEKLLTEYNPQKLLQKLLFLQQQGKLGNAQDTNKNFSSGTNYNNSNGENSEVNNLAGTLAYQQRQQQQDPPLPESVKMNTTMHGSNTNMNMVNGMPPMNAMPMGNMNNMSNNNNNNNNINNINNNNMNNNNMNRNIPGQPPFPMPMFGGFPPIPFPFNVPMGNMSPPPPPKK